jgi:hypothetical protein
MLHVALSLGGVVLQSSTATVTVASTSEFRIVDFLQNL